MNLGYEHLLFYGRMKGLKGSDVIQAAVSGLQSVNLLQSGHKQVKTYSGGMKRRLSVAISLIGTPEVVFLDEPSTVRNCHNLRVPCMSCSFRLFALHRAHTKVRLCMVAKHQSCVKSAISPLAQLGGDHGCHVKFCYFRDWIHHLERICGKW